MEKLISYIIVNLVKNPNEVTILKKDVSDGTLFTITVAQSDIGRVIGKNGNTISNIRLFVNSISDKKILIKIGE